MIQNSLLSETSSDLSGATFSPCQHYRYALWRIWDQGRAKLGFIMLNPSTADAHYNDPTIKKCINIAKHHDFGGIYVVNLFSLRATDPHNLIKHIAPIGEDTDNFIKQTLDSLPCVICAWGKNGQHLNRADAILGLLHKNKTYCLGKNLDGSPKHPLYRKNTQELLPFFT